MFCNKCGKALPDDAEFCVECGIRIVRREPGKAQIKAPAETSKEEPVESAKSVESAMPVESMESGVKKKGNGVKWWIFGGAAAALAAAAVLLVVILGGKGKLPAGLGDIAEKMAAGIGNTQTDGSGGTANLSLHFQEVIYKQGLPDARVFLTSGHDNLTVSGAEISVVKHMLPLLTEQKAYVLIEWDSDRDLDLCVFNAQTNQYINITSAVDDAGNFLYFYNSGADGYELIYLSDYTAGIYTVYVRDEASLLQGTGSSMEAEGLTVSIYTADGLLYYGKAEAAESAALWSPVYLYQGEAIGLSDSDCYIYDMTNYAWAVRDKNDESYARNGEVWSVEEDAALLASLQADDSSLRGLMETLVHELDDASIKSLLRGEKKGIEAFFAGEDPAAIALPYVCENQPSNSYELFIQTGSAYFLTEEQAQNLLYSICGKQMDFDLSAEEIGIAGYIG